MAAHTPGPWTLTDANEVVSTHNRRGHQGVIAEVCRYGTRAEARLNALLITAAPVLLSALERIGGGDIARAAIAEAEQQSEGVMGLEITAFRGLTRVENQIVDLDDNGNPVNCQEEWRAHPVSIAWANEHFPDRSEGIEPGAVYRWAERFDFRAGSYGSYNEWRDELARRAGYPSAKAVYREKLSGPFAELINFADNEGVIGPVVAKKLAADFAQHEDRITAGADEFFIASYRNWRRAFEMAANGGAVDFQ